MKDASERYRDDYLADYGFESRLVAWRRRLLVERLQALGPRTVLEVGCGPELLYRDYIAAAGAVGSWVVVEPVADWCTAAASSGLPNLHVVTGYLEDSVPALDAALPVAPDVVVCSHVLQQVADPAGFLATIRGLLAPHGTLLLLVANAASLHRRLAVAMGAIASVDALSARNQSGQQRRNYDLASLSTALTAAGFAVRAHGGHSAKPFTNTQMEAIAPHLGPDVLEGLFRLGRDAPELASEIYVEASVA